MPIVAHETNPSIIDRRLWVVAAIPLFFLITALIGTPPMTPAEPPDALLAFQAIGGIAAVFLWVRLDARAKGLRVSWMLWLALAGLSCIALPYYLLRSRGAGGGLRAIGWALAVFSLTMLAYRLGSHLSAAV